ncbi:uncharacterized protein GGS22DRAFT_176679 [Annulohypoxylon maeteangense]|uniref:uncharacterized protein n=1 Tax=Annulohypoxylon maeteangense TaxID=1927788 RepID=UPI0020077F9A|nr:uncharacterized protein GGS22DRAFT_176679 [Annulohypoxylon maeteangense]KAI0879809.1 hypothetical protein GGS22DRAFT_176679 [Annulohypoxylon maeteangense]
MFLRFVSCLFLRVMDAAECIRTLVVGRSVEMNRDHLVTAKAWLIYREPYNSVALLYHRRLWFIYRGPVQFRSLLSRFMSDALPAKVDRIVQVHERYTPSEGR